MRDLGFPAEEYNKKMRLLAYWKKKDYFTLPCSPGPLHQSGKT